MLLGPHALAPAAPPRLPRRRRRPTGATFVPSLTRHTTPCASLQELAGGPPSPFTLTEAQGDTLLTLTRSFPGGETINVDVMANDQPEEEPFESEDGVMDVDVGVVFNVQVVKGEMSLV